MAGFGSPVAAEGVSLASSPGPASPLSDIAKHVGPDSPVFVCLSRDSAASSHERLDGEPRGEGIPFNTLHVVPFESPLFRGRVVFNIAHLKPSPRCPPGTDPQKHALNGCQGRAMECIIQGQFKRRIRFDELYTGQSFSVPLRRLPARWLIKATQAVVKSLAPATQLNIVGPKPYLMGPLASIASFLSVTSPPLDGVHASHTDIFTVCEETALLGGAFADAPMDRNARKRYLSVPEHLTKHFFETDLVYGFGFFGDRWRVSECNLDIGVAQIDMASYLGQAPRVMARLKDTEEYAWAFDIWHERLLKKVDGAGEEEQQPTSEASADSSPHTPSTPDTPGLFGSPSLWPWFKADAAATSQGGSHTPRS